MFTDFHDIPFYTADNATVMERAMVKDLQAYERYCRDNGHFEQMNECYSDDAIVRVSWFEGSAKEYIRQIEEAGGEAAKHKINSTVVWLNGDKAVAETMVTMLSPRQNIDGHDFDLISYARIFSRFQKKTEMWKINYGDCIYERDCLVPTFPCKDLKIDYNEINQYRESYKCLCYVLSLSGHKTNQNQPGEDKPETVEKLYKEASQWLFQ